MKDTHKDKAHPKPKDGGMGYFHKEHWQKDIGDVEVSDGRYASEMNTQEEYKRQADGLASYVKKNKMNY